MSKKNMLAGFLAVFLVFNACGVYAKDEGVAAYEVAGEKVQIYISSSPVSTTIEDHIKQETGFYFFKLRYGNDFFNINIPQRLFLKLTESQKKELINSVTGLYDRSFDVLRNLLGVVPEGYKFNVTFARTQKGHPFNVVYLYSKTSNIYPDFIPYEGGEEIMTAQQEWVMLHEIGHSLFAISIGTIEDPKDRYMEEGFVDYLADKVLGEGHTGREAKGKIVITDTQAAAMRGLSQLDVDVSMWGEDNILNVAGMEGYPGITHHYFGLEFINTFIDVFGKKDLRVFLVRFRQGENAPDKGDYGTERIRDIFTRMGYSPQEISVFEKELHDRVKKNVFVVIQR